MKLTLLPRVAVLLSALFGVNACRPVATTEPTQPAEVSSFGLLQQRILTPSCATTGCHASAQDASFAQHGLVLAANVAYRHLVGAEPRNAAARADGLLRVKAFRSAESLLYHKLGYAPAHHGGQNYGNPMPLGGQPLSAGQIEFVRRWIEAGAPETGNVVDTTLLNDRTPVATQFEPLVPPAPGTGFQLTIEPFTVGPNFERELFVRKAIGNAQELYVSRFEMKMRPGSHHFLLYDFRNRQLLPPLNQVRDLRNADNSLNWLTALSMSNHVYFVGTQTPYLNYAFPEGAALLVPAGASFDLNAHYVNKTDQPRQGETFVNLYTVDKSRVRNVVRALDLNNTSLNIPARSRVTITRSFTFSRPRVILTLTSHMHKLGEKFVIRIKGGPRDGEVVYTTTDWEHPEILTFKTPLRLNAGEGLTSEITYNNTTARNVGFGLTSDDEMGIIFGYYYEE